MVKGVETMGGACCVPSLPRYSEIIENVFVKYKQIVQTDTTCQAKCCVKVDTSSTLGSKIKEVTKYAKFVPIHIPKITQKLWDELEDHVTDLYPADGGVYDAGCVILCLIMLGQISSLANFAESLHTLFQKAIGYALQHPDLTVRIFACELVRKYAKAADLREERLGQLMHMLLNVATMPCSPMIWNDDVLERTERDTLQQLHIPLASARKPRSAYDTLSSYPYASLTALKTTFDFIPDHDTYKGFITELGLEPLDKLSTPVNVRSLLALSALEAISSLVEAAPNTVNNRFIIPMAVNTLLLYLAPANHNICVRADDPSKDIHLQVLARQTLNKFSRAVQPTFVTTFLRAVLDGLSCTLISYPDPTLLSKYHLHSVQYPHAVLNSILALPQNEGESNPSPRSGSRLWRSVSRPLLTDVVTIRRVEAQDASQNGHNGGGQASQDDEKEVAVVIRGAGCCGKRVEELVEGPSRGGLRPRDFRGALLIYTQGKLESTQGNRGARLDEGDESKIESIDGTIDLDLGEFNELATPIAKHLASAARHGDGSKSSPDEEQGSASQAQTKILFSAPGTGEIPLVTLSSLKSGFAWYSSKSNTFTASIFSELLSVLMTQSPRMDIAVLELRSLSQVIPAFDLAFDYAGTNHYSLQQKQHVLASIKGIISTLGKVIHTNMNQSLNAWQVIVDQLILLLLYSPIDVLTETIRMYDVRHATDSATSHQQLSTKADFKLFSYPLALVLTLQAIGESLKNTDDVLFFVERILFAVYCTGYLKYAPRLGRTVVPPAAAPIETSNDSRSSRKRYMTTHLDMQLLPSRGHRLTLLMIAKALLERRLRSAKHLVLPPHFMNSVFVALHREVDPSIRLFAWSMVLRLSTYDHDVTRSMPSSSPVPTLRWRTLSSPVKLQSPSLSPDESNAADKAAASENADYVINSDKWLSIKQYAQSLGRAPDAARPTVSGNISAFLKSPDVQVLVSGENGASLILHLATALVSNQLIDIDDPIITKFFSVDAQTASGAKIASMSEMRKSEQDQEEEEEADASQVLNPDDTSALVFVNNSNVVYDAPSQDLTTTVLIPRPGIFAATDRRRLVIEALEELSHVAEYPAAETGELPLPLREAMRVLSVFLLSDGVFGVYQIAPYFWEAARRASAVPSSGVSPTQAAHAKQSILAVLSMLAVRLRDLETEPSVEASGDANVSQPASPVVLKLIECIEFAEKLVPMPAVSPKQQAADSPQASSEFALAMQEKEADAEVADSFLNVLLGVCTLMRQELYNIQELESIKPNETPVASDYDESKAPQSSSLRLTDLGDGGRHDVSDDDDDDEGYITLTPTAASDLARKLGIQIPAHSEIGELPLSPESARLRAKAAPELLRLLLAAHSARGIHQSDESTTEPQSTHIRRLVHTLLTRVYEAYTANPKQAATAQATFTSLLGLYDAASLSYEGVVRHIRHIRSKETETQLRQRAQSAQKQQHQPEPVIEVDVAEVKLHISTEPQSDVAAVALTGDGDVSRVSASSKPPVSIANLTDPTQAWKYIASSSAESIIEK